MSRPAGGQESALFRRSASLQPPDWLPAVILVAVTLLAYLPAMRAGFVWDDNDYVTNNAALKAPAGLRRIWLDNGSTPQYYPLVFTVFRLEYALWGLQPAGYHAVNIVLHAAGSLLLWRLLSGLGLPGAWWAALIFAVHPVNVESVALVSELKNVLSGFFYLAALCAALRFYLPGNLEKPCVPFKDGTQGCCRGWPAYGIAFLLFACALLSKTVTCSLPVAILLILWWKRGRFSRFEVATLLPFFVLGAALAFNTVALEKSHVGAVGPEWDLSIVQRILIAGRALWFYAGKLVCPFPLIFVYPRWDVDAAVPWHCLFPLAAAAALAALWLLRARIGRGPAAAALFFALTLVPALGFFNTYPMLYSFVADHFVYLAGIGPIALAVGAAARWAQGEARNRQAMIFCGAAAVTALSALAWDRCCVYKDNETLWLDTLGKNPGAWVAWNNLGSTYYQEGLCEKAVPFFDKSIELNGKYAMAYNNRAGALTRLGRYAAALDDFNAAIELRPGWADAWNNRSVAHVGLGQYPLAVEDCDRAISLKPDFASAWYNRGEAHGRMRRYDLALDDYNQAIDLKPDYAEAYNNRAVANFRLKNYDQAWADVKTARRLGFEPNQAFLQTLAQASGRTE